MYRTEGGAEFVDHRNCIIQGSQRFSVVCNRFNGVIRIGQISTIQCSRTVRFAVSGGNQIGFAIRATQCDSRSGAVTGSIFVSHSLCARRGHSGAIVVGCKDSAAVILQAVTHVGHFTCGIRVGQLNQFQATRVSTCCSQSSFSRSDINSRTWRGGCSLNFTACQSSTRSSTRLFITRCYSEGTIRVINMDFISTIKARIGRTGNLCVVLACCIIEIDRS